MPRAAYTYWADTADLMTAIRGARKYELLAAATGPLYVLAWEETRPWKEQGVFFQQFDQVGDVSRYTEGRLFGALGEMHWRRRDKHVHGLLLTDIDSLALPSGFEGVQPLAMAEVEYHRLWGRHGRDAQGKPIWREGRIPHDLRYPVDLGDERPEKKELYVWLVTQRYLGDRGEVMFTRYAGLLPGEKAPPA